MKYSDYRNEEWKEMELEGLKDGEMYQISNYGKIKYFNQKTKKWEIKNTCTIQGYSYYSWFKSNRGNNHKMTKIVHRIVASHFCRKPNEDYKYVAHMNFEKKDNYYENLRWMTHDEISRHKQRNPSVIAAKYDKNGNPRSAKLTETQVIRLKMKLKKGKNPYYKIAKEFGISHTQLKRIRRGENWANVKID